MTTKGNNITVVQSRSTIETHEVITTLSDFTTSPKVNSTGFVIAADYYQQQIGAAINLFNFQTWATSVGANVVEPFVAGSKYVMPHNLSKPSTNYTLRFRDYFDIHYWNSYSINSNVNPLASWEEFIIAHPQRLIVVIIVLKTTSRIVWENDQIEEDPHCYQQLLRFNELYYDSIREFLHIEVIRKVCFTFGKHHNSTLKVEDFNQFIYGGLSPHKMTVWFACWTGITKGRMNIAGSQYQLSTMPYSMIKASDRVKNDSKKYITQYLGSNYIAISVRTAKPWMIASKKHDTDYVRSHLIHCINELRTTLSTVQISKQTSVKPFLAIDLGRYGDSSAGKFIDKETMTYLLQEVISTVYHNTTTVEEWEDTFLRVTGGQKDKGYIAAVQAGIVETAGCVIMFGGHSKFQDSIVTSYYHRAQGKFCLYKVCYDETY